MVFMQTIWVNKHEKEIRKKEYGFFFFFFFPWTQKTSFCFLEREDQNCKIGANRCYTCTTVSLFCLSDKTKLFFLVFILNANFLCLNMKIDRRSNRWRFMAIGHAHHGIDIARGFWSRWILENCWCSP